MYPPYRTTLLKFQVGGRLRCIGSPQHLKTRFGNHLELEVKRFGSTVFCFKGRKDHFSKHINNVDCLTNQVKPNEVSHVDLENFCQLIQQWLFNFPSQPRSLLGDLEVCIGVSDSITPDEASASEISLSPEMIQSIAKYLGNEQRVNTLVSPMPEEDLRFNEQLSEQLFRDGMSTRTSYIRFQSFPCFTTGNTYICFVGLILNRWYSTANFCGVVASQRKVFSVGLFHTIFVSRCNIQELQWIEH